MAGLFTPMKAPAIQAPPPVPSLADPQIQEQARQRAAMANQGGRASTYLTDPSSQRTPEASRRRYALGDVL